MNGIDDASVIEALRRQMALAAARQVVASSNLANVSTPGYRTQEVDDFSQTLDRKLSPPQVSLARTEERHIAGTEKASVRTEDAPGLASRRDGNNVQIDRELLTMARAAGQFAQAQTALSAKFRLLRYAINESR